MRPNTIAVPRPLGAIFMGDGTIDTLLTRAPGIAASVGTPAAVAAAGGIATTAGAALSVAIPVAGIVIGAVIGSLFAAHARRVAGAKQENQILNSLIPTVQQAVAAVFDALNSGQTTAADAIAALDQIEQQYWQAVQQVEHGPGQAGGPSRCVSVPGAGLRITGTPTVQNPPGSGYSSYGPDHFDRSCTASCGVGCMWVASWVNVGKKLIQAGGGQVSFDPVASNNYGLQSFPGLSISYTPPPPGSISAMPALASSSFLGIPVWMIIGGLLAWKVL
jgi:hypothetical protein